MEWRFGEKGMEYGEYGAGENGKGRLWTNDDVFGRRNRCGRRGEEWKREKKTRTTERPCALSGAHDKSAKRACGSGVNKTILEG
mmetsp:Transcript_21729/g.40567  ORF Transcript_21729/g.40567 Transcript_21729/m.40567 type:complete len:84 (+) Transcript_21729:203-454(+)